MYWQTLYLLARFNPRSHEGSDVCRSPWPYRIRCFNPRSHEGSDMTKYDVLCLYETFQSTLPRRERQQFRPKIHSNFQQKSTNYHFIYLIFPFFHPLFFLHSTSFVHILECESPGIFMCASYSHSYIITKYIICCNSTIGTFFCFIYKSAPFL